MLGKTRACATVVPVLQLRVLRDKWYHGEVVGAVTVRQLKGNREMYRTPKAFANSSPGNALGNEGPLVNETLKEFANSPGHVRFNHNPFRVGKNPLGATPG